jgi:subtilase family serine protease
MSALLLVSLTFMFGLPQSVSPLLAAHTNAHDQSYRLPGHVALLLKHTKPVGKLAASMLLHLSVVLKLRNQETLDALLAAQNDPASPLYHQYLTPHAFAAQFSPTSATVNRVVAYLQSNGLHVTSIATDHVLIDASATVAIVEKAFAITLNDYILNGRQVYAPSADPDVSVTMVPYIQCITGLDDIAIYHPHPPIIEHSHVGHASSYTPGDLHTAYNVGPLLTDAACAAPLGW